MNMNLDIYLGHAPKDFVADYYYKIVDFSKDYEKITKKKTRTKYTKNIR